MAVGQILNRELFLYLLDLEVKRARRYQNFFCILTLRLTELRGPTNGNGLHNCYQKLSHLLREELRESDILGSLGHNLLAALLPYADPSASTNVRSRFEANLRLYNFQQDGYSVMIDQIYFPKDGTVAADLISKVTGIAQAG